jgi:hypothetical protein
MHESKHFLPGQFVHSDSVGTTPNSNIKIVERGNMDIPYKQIHDHSLFWIGTGISVKIGVKRQPSQITARTALLQRTALY